MIKKVFLDTDIGPDCDDTAALAMLNLYADKDLCDILGVAHCTSNPYGAGTIDAINRYYGRPEVPIGTYVKKGFLDGKKTESFNKYITTTLPNRYKDTQPENAVTLYRRILAKQDNHSVTFIAIGPLNNLSDLLNSPGDEFSSLTGLQLVEQKATQLVLMAGLFVDESTMPTYVKKAIPVDISSFAEFNVVCDIPAAQNVASRWPTPMVYLGFEAGIVETGAPLQTEVPKNHPVRIAYNLYTENGDRYSWDLLTVEYAIDSTTKHYNLSPKGSITIDNKGFTHWEEKATGQHQYIKLAKCPQEIKQNINRLLVAPPKGGFPEK